MPSESPAALAAALGLDEAFPADVLAEARALGPGTDDPSLADRVDVPFCTIDYPTSMDLDQAVHVARDAGGWRVRYAIADASWFVRPGTALHAEALRRGGTVYLPGLTARMLPAELSEGVVSLLPDVDRRAVIFDLRVNADGSAGPCSIERARIRSVLKTSYGAVQDWFDGRGRDPAPAVAASLRALAEVGEARLHHGEGRGVVRIRRTEVAVSSGPGGRFVALREVRTAVERWNEQISLLANARGAELLAGISHLPGVRPIYRVVAPPGEPELEALRATGDRLIALHGLPEAARWQPGEALADWLARVPEDAVGQALHRAAMLVGGSALYRPEPGPHAGVGATVYARFTAPMREVVGVFLHRELLDGLAGRTSPEDGPDGAAGEALREAVIASASRHRRLQRDADRAVNEQVLDALFAEDLAAGRARGAVLLGAGSGKLHVTLDDPPIDAKVYVAHTPGMRVAGLEVFVGDRRLARVGDRVTVRVTGRASDRWALALAVG